jgi:uncharacterized membrane protein
VSRFVSETALTRERDPRGGGLVSLRGKVRVDATGIAAATRVVYGGTAAYAALFVFAAVLHYVVFSTARADLGTMVQAIWNTQHGHPLETTTFNGAQVDRLGTHVDPFLLLFVPLLWIWSSPLLLPVVQALAVASGALPVFWLARKHLGSSRAGVQFAFAYLLFPATQFNAFTIAASFHPMSMAVPLVLYAIWFLDEDRLLAFSLVALLAFTTNEVVPLAVGFLGIWYAVRKRRRAVGLSIFGVGLAVTLFDFLWVIPHFSPRGVNPFADRYRAVGGTPTGIAHKLVSDPGAFVHAVASGHKATFVGLLVIPFLGLCLLEPLLFLAALPALAIDLLSSWGNQTSIGYEDTAAIVPFVVAASIFGAARFKGRGRRLSLWVLAAVAIVAIYSPIYFIGRDVRALGSASVSTKSRALSLIPGGVPVAASNELGSHLSKRRYIYTFPYVRRSRWIIVDINDSTSQVPGFRRYVRQYESDKTWRIVFSANGVDVLHKRTRG